MIYFTEAQLKEFAETMWKAGYNKSLSDFALSEWAPPIGDEGVPMSEDQQTTFKHDYKEARNGT